MGLMEKALTETSTAKGHSGLLERANRLQSGERAFASPKKKLLREKA
jgi:hypothetical protein